MEFIKALMEKHASSMVRLAYRRTGNTQLSEDLVQETFLMACCKLDQIYNHPKPEAWLFKVLNRLIMRELDKAYHTAEVPMSEEILAGQTEIELPMEHYLPSGLSDGDRELILMRVDRGLSFAELAEYYGITEAACRQRVSRVIRKCRSLMEAELTGQKNYCPCHKTKTSSDE